MSDPKNIPSETKIFIGGKDLDDVMGELSNLLHAGADLLGTVASALTDSPIWKSAERLIEAKARIAEADAVIAAREAALANDPEVVKLKRDALIHTLRSSVPKGGQGRSSRPPKKREFEDGKSRRVKYAERPVAKLGDAISPEKIKELRKE